MNNKQQFFAAFVLCSLFMGYSQTTLFEGDIAIIGIDTSSEDFHIWIQYKIFSIFLLYSFFSLTNFSPIKFKVFVNKFEPVMFQILFFCKSLY